MFDVRKILIQNITENQNSLQRALVALDKAKVWRLEGHELKRAEYLARWCSDGKNLTGAYIGQARKLVLDHIEELLPITLQKTQEEIVRLKKRISSLEQWVEGLESQMGNDPFDEGKTPCLVMETCMREGLY